MSFACRPNWSVGVVSLAAIPMLIESTAFDPADATVSVSLTDPGSGDYVGDGGTTAFNWLTPNYAGAGSSYWARMTVNSGAALSGSATGSWLALSSTRSWSLTRATIGNVTSNVTLAIASDAAGTNILATVSFTIYCEVT